MFLKHLEFLVFDFEKFTALIFIYVYFYRPQRSWADTQTFVQCMLGYTPLPPSACWDTVNKRTVRILLERILV